MDPALQAALLAALQPAAAPTGPAGVQMDLQAALALAALQGMGASGALDGGTFGVPSLPSGNKAGAPNRGGRTRSGDSRSSSAYASRHQVGGANRARRPSGPGKATCAAGPSARRGVL